MRERFSSYWWLDIVFMAQSLRYDCETMEFLADGCGIEAANREELVEPDPHFLAAMFRVAEGVRGRFMQEVARLRKEYPEVYNNMYDYDDECEHGDLHEEEEW